MSPAPAAAHVFIASSLDGFIARDDGDIRWLTSHPVPEGEDFGYAAFIAGMDRIVMGRGTYETVREFAPWPYPLPVTVLSRSLGPDALVPGADVTLSGETPAALLARLGGEGAANIYVDGGMVIQSFLRAGLVRRMTITWIPVLLGSGRRLFGPAGQDITLTLESATSWPNGFVQTVHLPLPR